VEEIQTLPQLVSGTSKIAVKLASELFSKIAPEVIEMSTTEAEFAKLISNAYRYIQFAATNQLYMLVESAGLDYNKLLTKMKQGYPRMGSIPSAGFAAGPCLMKDTMQLFSFEKKNFFLGQVAMTINEGLPDFMISQLISKTKNIINVKVGILGMAFKAECDDIRDSLSYRLKKTLEFKGALVFCSDEFVTGAAFVSKEELVKNCDIIIVGVPHKAYGNLVIPQEKEVIDLWNIL
jgi:UDP-N-acetyl-D-mannosaminuronic acid dehydrogenase